MTTTAMTQINNLRPDSVMETTIPIFRTRLLPELKRRSYHFVNSLCG